MRQKTCRQVSTLLCSSITYKDSTNELSGESMIFCLNEISLVLYHLSNISTEGLGIDGLFLESFFLIIEESCRQHYDKSIVTLKIVLFAYIFFNVFFYRNI